MPNRLARETSPYLLQHRDNPVDWYAWGAEALERARIEAKPILLSIGYSACHWCHVMEHESFENADTARLMNENYVCVKVDREERPDLDHIYQNVAQALTHGGGWPLTVFLTPELKPFYGGTYFPPEDKYGRPGFPRVLRALADAFRDDRAAVSENAQKLSDWIERAETRSAAVQPAPGGPPADPMMEGLKAAAEGILPRIDWQEGGLAGAPKFPNPMLLGFLWRLGLAVGDERAREAALLSLRKMARGGIFDQLGGGFSRYSVDETWSVPHFEKMLYDNALLLKLYAEVLLSGEGLLHAGDRELFAHVLASSVRYVERELVAPEGGLYSAQDADSEGEEGKYYAWNLEDLNAAVASGKLTSEESEAAARFYGITPSGNFEHGKTVLFVASPLKPRQEALLESARSKLLAIRSERVPPATDTKVLTGWNGLMVSGLSWAARALAKEGMAHEAALAESRARSAFDAVAARHSFGHDRLYATGKLNGYLDDYAFMAMAALDLARVAPAPEVSRYIGQADRWIGTVLGFFAASEPGYFFTSSDHEALIQRPRTLFDQAIPAGTAVVLECLLALEEMDWQGGAARYSEEVARHLPALFPLAISQPFGMGETLSACLLASQGPIVVSGTGAESLCRHPHVFRKPAAASEGKLLACQHKSCEELTGEPWSRLYARLVPTGVARGSHT